MTRPAPRRCLALSVLVAAALAAVPSASAAQQTVTLPAQDRVLAGAPTPLFSIGREEGRSWEMLSNVGQVVFGPRDELYVLDRGNERVLVFDARGRFVRQVGKEGSGPGEFRVPMGMALLRGDTLVVADLGNRTFSLFGPDGAFARSVAFGEGTVPLLTMGIVGHPAGGIAGAFRELPADRSPSGTFRVGGPVLTRFALRPGTKPVRLFAFPGGSTVRQNVEQPAAGQVRITRMLPSPPTFSPPDLFAVLPSGELAVAHENAWSVKVLDASGRHVRTLRRPVRIRAATERDRARAREERRASMLSGRNRVVMTFGDGPARAPLGPSPQEVDAMVAQLQFADSIAPLRNLRATPAGKLWVQRTGAEWSDVGPIDVVTAAGRYVGTLRGQKLPAAISATGRAAYLERDELDVERVVVRQLPAGWR